jgi:hypothetical protein
MSLTRIDIFCARLQSEEGQKFFAYDDRTGLQVRAPVGKITWGRGYNLEQCGSKELFDTMDRVLVTQIDRQLQPFDWYHIGTESQLSVPLDVAFNGGVHGLLNYPHMLAAWLKKDWVEAAAQCAVKDELLDKSRYAPLRQLILKTN